MKLLFFISLSVFLHGSCVSITWSSFSLSNTVFEFLFTLMKVLEQKVMLEMLERRTCHIQTHTRSHHSHYFISCVVQDCVCVIKNAVSGPVKDVDVTVGTSLSL